MPLDPSVLKTSEPSASPPLLTAVRRALADADASGLHLLAAVSGGADSLALLELLADLRDEGTLQLTVAHVDHGIQAAAMAAEAIVRQRARVRDVPVVCAALQLGSAATETQARRARHRALRRLRIACGAEAIVLAHHEDDQAETVLMRVLHGTAPLGLAGMSLRRGRLLRPLLGIPRAALLGECAARGIVAWADPANQDRRHERSWLRSDILPRLAARDPEVAGKLGAVAGYAAEAREAWCLALRALPDLAYRPRSGEPASIVAGPLGQYDSVLASALLRALAAETGCPLTPVRARRLLTWLARASRGGWSPVGDRWRAELVRGRVSFRRVSPRLATTAVIGASESGQAGPVLWQTSAALDQRAERGGPVQEFAAGTYQLRPSRPGDRIVPLGGLGSRRVVRCLQDAGIAGGRRANWPVLVHEEAVVWVVGVCRGADRLPVPGTRSLRVAVES